MYCSYLLLASMTVLVASAQVHLQRQIPIVKMLVHTDHAGQYSYQTQGADGTVQAETGVLKQKPDGSDNYLVKSGYYFYQSPEGRNIKIDYVADENGFHATGDAIPVQTVDTTQV